LIAAGIALAIIAVVNGLGTNLNLSGKHLRLRKWLIPAGLNPVGVSLLATRCHGPKPRARRDAL
jgi:hypothetical protein